MAKKTTIYQRKSEQENAVFGYYCDKWLAANKARLKESSYQKYRKDMENHIKPFWGECLPSEIVSEMVDRFTDMLLHEKKLSAKTVRDILTLFHSVFVSISRRTELKLNNLEIIYPKEHKKIIRVLNKKEEEILTLFLVREMDLSKFGVYIALRTGMRIGEICALRWGDISLQAETISINHTVQRLKNPDAAATAKTAVILDTPKSDSSSRTIPLMQDIKCLCSRFLSNNPEAFVLTGTTHCMDPRQLQRRLKSYVIACDIEKVHFHTLRHTFATRCIEAGFDIKTLSEILGHSNVSITMNQYVHPDLNLKRKNMNRLKPVICF